VVAVPPERLFDDEQLELLATPLSIRLERAADAGDAAAVDGIADEMDAETLAIYDAYINWMGVLQAYIHERGGEHAHDEALRWVAEYAVRPFVMPYGQLDLRGRALLLAERLRASGSTFSVEAEPGRVRFSCDPWGPQRWWRPPHGWESEEPRRREGDRIYYPQYGGGEDPRGRFPTLRGARPLTQGREDLPCVLASEVQFLELMPIELFGRPLAVLGLPEDPAGVVTLDLHADPADVPAEVYERVGLARPASGVDSDPRGRTLSAEEALSAGIPLSIQARKAASEGNWERLRELSAGMDRELVGAKDPYGIAIAGLLSWIARRYGEDAGEEALERTAEVVMAPFLAGVKDLDITQSVPAWAVAWRSHGSTFWIEEHDEYMVFRGRPLGACARMWASAYQREVERISDSRVRYPTFGSFQPPASFHRMREPRGITHGKTSYPIYSCHCHMLHEIYPIDQIGRPLWVENHPLDDPDGETVHVHWKDPNAWPEHYYEQVGRRKPAAVGGEA
jgi:hypothetical protein